MLHRTVTVHHGGRIHFIDEADVRMQIIDTEDGHRYRGMTARTRARVRERARGEGKGNGQGREDTKHSNGTVENQDGQRTAA